MSAVDRERNPLGLTWDTGFIDISCLHKVMVWCTHTETPLKLFLYSDINNLTHTHIYTQTHRSTHTNTHVQTDALTTEKHSVTTRVVFGRGHFAFNVSQDGFGDLIKGFGAILTERTDNTFFFTLRAALAQSRPKITSQTRLSTSSAKSETICKISAVDLLCFQSCTCSNLGTRWPACLHGSKHPAER